MILYVVNEMWKEVGRVFYTVIHYAAWVSLKPLVSKISCSSSSALGPGSALKIGMIEALLPRSQCITKRVQLLWPHPQVRTAWHYGLLWLESPFGARTAHQCKKLGRVVTVILSTVVQLRHSCQISRPRYWNFIAVLFFFFFWKPRYRCFYHSTVPIYTGSIRCYVLNKLDASSNGVYAV